MYAGAKKIKQREKVCCGISLLKKKDCHAFLLVLTRMSKLKQNIRMDPGFKSPDPHRRKTRSETLPKGWVP